MYLKVEFKCYALLNVKLKLSHIGLELQKSFKEVPRGNQYGKLTVRHHVFRNYVSPNQTRLVVGLFGLQSGLTSGHVCSEGTCG